MIYSYYDGPHGRTTFFNDSRSLVRCIPDGRLTEFADHQLLLDLHEVKIDFKSSLRHYDENQDTLDILAKLPLIPKDRMHDGLD